MKKICILLMLVFYMSGCSDKINEKGFYTEGKNVGINKSTGTEFDTSGYDISGYDKDGFDKDGIHKTTKTAFDESGFNRSGFDKEGYNKSGFDKNNYDRKGYDAWGYDKHGYHRDGYNKRGYNKDGFDKNGYSIKGFDKNNIHKITKTTYDEKGFNFKGIHKTTNSKYNEDGYDVEGNNVTSILKTDFYIGNFVNEFGDFIGKKFIGYKGTAQEISDDRNKNKNIELVVSSNRISFTLSPYVFLNSNGNVSCYFKIDDKVYEQRLSAYKNEFFISKDYNPKEYSKFIKLFKNSKKIELVVYNYDYTTRYKSSFNLTGFKELSEIIKIK